MDLRRLLARKRQRLDAVEAEAAQLREQVTTLERALEIAMADETEAGSAPVAIAEPRPSSVSVISTARFATIAAEEEERGQRSLIETIRDVVRDLPEPFSTGTVRNRVMDEEPGVFAKTHHSSIPGTMRRMSLTGELVPVEKGGPGKEATYRRGRGQVGEAPQSSMEANEEVG